MKTHLIPKKFQPDSRVKYPPHNDMTLEQFVFYAIKDLDIKTRLSYVPIFWTPYYCAHQRGNYTEAVQDVKNFCTTIKEPWFTISQYDHGILFGHQDMPTEFVSLSAIGVGDVILPLPSYPWPDSTRQPLKYIASFMGYMPIDPIRKKMFEILQGTEGFYLEDVHYPRSSYKDVMLQSKYALCPRGCGNTSFRLYEAMQMGTEPLYLTDDPWLPEGLQGIVPIIKSTEIESLRNLKLEGEDRSEFFKKVWQEQCSYEACTKLIIKTLEEKYGL